MADNLLLQKFQPPASNRFWASDIVYISTTDGWRYLAVWNDLFSRRVVGWMLEPPIETSPVIEAFNRALGHRQVEPEQLLIHTDQDGQYRANDNRQLLESQMITSSMSAKAAAGTKPCWRASSPPSNLSWATTTTARF